MKLKYFLISLVFAFAISCSDEGSKKFFIPGDQPVDTNIVNDSGGNVGNSENKNSDAIVITDDTAGTAITIDNPTDTTPSDNQTDNTYVPSPNASISAQIAGGNFIIVGNDLILSSLVDNVYQLVSGVTVVIKDNSGNIVSGDFSVDTTGNIIFTPAGTLTVNSVYTVTVTAYNNQYATNVMIAVDNMEKPNSMFANVDVLQSGVYWIKDLFKNGKAIAGWKFPPRFWVKLQSIDKDAKVVATFYGVYDIPGYETLVFYQRWIKTQIPVKDYSWGNDKWLYVTEEDITIPGKTFAYTYIELKVYDKDGKDITETCKAKIHFKADSTIAAYLLYIKDKTQPLMLMISIGLIVGVIISINVYRKIKLS